MADGVILDNVLANWSPGWLSPLSLTVPVGTFLAIETPPAFSSLLFRLMLGLDTPRAGHVSILGTQIHALGRAERRSFRSTIGSVLVPDGLIANHTLLENLIIPFVYSHGRTLADAKRQSMAILETFQLDSAINEHPTAISPDLRQTAALARALVGSPEVLLLDNALASVDSVERNRLLAISRQVVPTIIAASHHADQTLFDAADNVASWDADGFRLATPA